MLHEMEQLHQLQADLLRILPMGIKKNPYRAVFQDPLFVFHTAHLERVPVTAIADQVEGGDENQDDIAQKAEIHRPRLQQLHIDVGSGSSGCAGAGCRYCVSVLPYRRRGYPDPWPRRPAGHGGTGANPVPPSPSGAGHPGGLPVQDDLQDQLHDFRILHCSQRGSGPEASV